MQGGYQTQTYKASEVSRQGGAGAGAEAVWPGHQEGTQLSRPLCGHVSMCVCVLLVLS